MVGSSKGFLRFANTVLMLLVLFCLTPLLLLVVSSITEESALLTSGYSFIPRRINLLAYQYLLSDSRAVLSAYGVTLFITIAGTLCNVVITLLFAYPLSRKELPCRNAFAFILFFTMLFGGGLVPTYIMWTQILKIKNTIWALLLPGLLFNPFNVIMMRTYFTSTVPDSVVEAARIDGAGETRTLVQVVLPMAVPIIATVSLLVALGYWNDWMNGFYYVNDERLFSIQVLLNKMLMDVQYLQSTTVSGASNAIMAQLPSTGLKMAVAVLGAAPMLFVFPFFMKYFVKGITVGAVKG